MTEQADSRPFNIFNFEIELVLEGGSDTPMCNAAFAECEGLEMSMKPKTYSEGGNNVGQIHLVGQVAYGQLTLRRGMTSNFDLWSWFDEVMTTAGHGKRASCTVTMLSTDRATPRARFRLSRCLPVKLRAPGLNARGTEVAIEELQLVYERLEFEAPRPAEEDASPEATP